MSAPYNPCAHAYFLAAGYAFTHIDPSWQDAGTAESGPDLQGEPGWDEYAGDDHTVYVLEDGTAHFETYQPGPPDFEGEENICLTGQAEWDDFAAKNAEALAEQFGSVEAAFVECRETGLIMGGGAAPVFRIFFQKVTE